MMEVLVTNGAIRHAKFQQKCHHQQTNTQFFFYNKPDAIPVAQLRVSKHRREVNQCLSHEYLVWKNILSIPSKYCLVKHRPQSTPTND